jgi:hypothetical protein
MTDQLVLLQGDHIDDAADAPAPAQASPAATPIRAGRRSRSASVIGRLDRRTIATGRKGVESARAELASATRRAAERDRLRAEQRQAELERLTGRTRPGSTGERAA